VQKESSLANEVIVRSPYMKNISTSILDSQKRVFEALGIPLEQVLVTSQKHGDWLNETVCFCDDKIIAFCDIDAFPITTLAYKKAINSASAKRVFGLAQSNSFDNETSYAAPMFQMFSRETYDYLGKPDLRSGVDCDAGQRLSMDAVHMGFEIELLYPNAVI